MFSHCRMRAVNKTLPIPAHHLVSVHSCTYNFYFLIQNIFVLWSLLLPLDLPVSVPEFSFITLSLPWIGLFRQCCLIIYLSRYHRLLSEHLLYGFLIRSVRSNTANVRKLASTLIWHLEQWLVKRHPQFSEKALERSGHNHGLIVHRSTLTMQKATMDTTRRLSQEEGTDVSVSATDL